MLRHGVADDDDVRRLRAMTPGERLRLGCDLIEAAWVLSRAGRARVEALRDGRRGLGERSP